MQRFHCCLEALLHEQRQDIGSIVYVAVYCGLGFARGIGAINMRVVSGIVASWFITVPFTAILAAVLFAVGRLWIP